MNFKVGRFSNGSLSPGEDFLFKCLIKSIARAAKESKIKLSTDILKYMGLLPADYGFHYVIHKSIQRMIGLGSGESSGSKSLPTSWSDVWELFSKRKCPKAKPLVDLECPNPLEQTLLNCFKFLLLPKTYCDIFGEGFGNRIRIIIRFTEGVGCQFWWTMWPLNDDTGLTTFIKLKTINNFLNKAIWLMRISRSPNLIIVKSFLV
jgi:hypothetical protein